MRKKKKKIAYLRLQLQTITLLARPHLLHLRAYSLYGSPLKQTDYLPPTNTIKKYQGK